MTRRPTVIVFSWLAFLILAQVAAGTAAAQTRRIAILVGNNAGAGPRPALRFAETDAVKLERVLIDLGGFSREDVHLLQGRSAADLQTAFQQVRASTQSWRTGDGRRVVLLFYFSGHSDGEALELGSDRVLFGHLRRLLAQVGADVRLAIVDSCNSGALLAAKGGKLGPAFDIRFADDVASSGEALLTSSAADELALESREVGASFFSHHLLSGLRGAADASGDGRVTLAEAYRYAFTHTLVATSDALTGPQHPVYDYRLSGQGELVLTEVQQRSARLSLPHDGGRILVQDAAHGQVMAEVTMDSARRLALPPGRYRLLGRRGTAPVEGLIDLKEGEDRLVAAQELKMVVASRSLPKGGDPTADATLTATAEPPIANAPVTRHAVLVAGGIGAGATDAMGAIPALRVGRRPSSGAGGWRATLTLTTGTGTGFRETTSTLGAGYGLSLTGRRMRLGLAAEVGIGGIVQDIADAPRAWSPMVAATATGESGVRVSRDTWLVLEAALPAAVLRRDGHAVAALLPVVTLGIAVNLP